MDRRVAAVLFATAALLLPGCSTPSSSASTPGPTTGSSSATTLTTTTTTTTTTAPDDPSLAFVGALDDLWTRTPAGSCLVVTDGNEVLYERNPDQVVVPASAMKLLTATVALARLGPDTRLRTPVLAATPLGPDGVVHGDLWLVGGGDPVLGTQPWGAHFTRQPRLVTSIEVLADRLVASGVRHVTGGVVGDDGRYDHQRYVPSWPARYLTDSETGPLSSLTVNDGLAVWGDDPVPFADPAAGAAGVLTALLRERGVTVAREGASGEMAPGAVELAAVESPTIAELTTHMLLDSDNGTAELLVKELGRRVLDDGSTSAGGRVIVDTLALLDLPVAGTWFVDGSGLDPTNVVTCRLLTALLQRLPSLAEALPVAAQTGTLSKRFLATPVAGHLRAKTGSIRSVVSLVGTADGAHGRPLTFAYVVNGSGGSAGRRLQDELGHVLVLVAP